MIPYTYGFLWTLGALFEHGTDVRGRLRTGWIEPWVRIPPPPLPLSIGSSPWFEGSPLLSLSVKLTAEHEKHRVSCHFYLSFSRTVSCRGKHLKMSVRALTKTPMVNQYSLLVREGQIIKSSQQCSLMKRSLLFRLRRLDLLADFFHIMLRFEMCFDLHIARRPARLFLLRRCLHIP